MPNKFAPKSDQNWALAKELHQLGHLDAAANRYYYSVFQAVKGYAVGISRMSEAEHDGVHSKILRIVQDHSSYNGAFYRRRLNALLTERINGDYYSYSVDPADLGPLLADVESTRNFFRNK